MIEEKMKELGYELPEPTKLPPGFKHKGVLVHENIVYVGATMPIVNGELPYYGKIGDTVTVEQGQELTRLCVLTMLANVKNEIGSLNKVNQILKITGYVASAPGFTDQALILNAATDLLLDIFGEIGIHARTAIGVPVGTVNAPVKIDMTLDMQST